MHYPRAERKKGLAGPAQKKTGADAPAQGGDKLRNTETLNTRITASAI
jgi:hypothetical protein